MASVRPKKWRSKTAPPTTKRSSWIGEYESSKTTGCEGKDATPPDRHNEALPNRFLAFNCTLEGPKATLVPNGRSRRHAEQVPSFLDELFRHGNPPG